MSLKAAKDLSSIFAVLPDLDTWRQHTAVFWSGECKCLEKRHIGFTFPVRRLELDVFFRRSNCCPVIFAEAEVITLPLRGLLYFSSELWLCSCLVLCCTVSYSFSSPITGQFNLFSIKDKCYHQWPTRRPNLCLSVVSQCLPPMRFPSLFCHHLQRIVWHCGLCLRQSDARMRKSRGASTVPCGTEPLTLKSLEIAWFTTASSALFVRKLCIHLPIFPSYLHFTYSVSYATVVTVVEGFAKVFVYSRQHLVCSPSPL